MISETTHKAIALIEEHFQLRDSLIEKLNMEYLQGELSISMTIHLATGGQMSLVFSGVEESSFYHHWKYDYYLINDLKLLKTESAVYISMDPDETSEGISEEDQNFILAKEFSAKIIEGQNTSDESK